MEKPLLMDDDITMQDIALNFPHKLHLLLDERRYPHLLTWKEHGCCFHIIDKNLFSSEVLPQAFKQSKWGSFQRQLNCYGFKKISKGNDKGCYFHPYFRTGREDLLPKLKRFHLMKDLLLNSDNYYYTKLLPTAAKALTPSSTPTFPPQTLNTMMMMNSSSSAVVSPSSLSSTSSSKPIDLSTQSLDSIHHPLHNPFESTTNPLIQQQKQQQLKPPPPPQEQSRPISFQSFFFRSKPTVSSSSNATVSSSSSSNQSPPHISPKLPPMPSLHKPMLNVNSSTAMMFPFIQKESRMTIDDDDSTITTNTNHFPERTISLSEENSSVSPSINTESDSYVTSTSLSLDMMDVHINRDPYRFHQAYLPPPVPMPFIGMMIGGSMQRQDDETVYREEDDEETIDRYIVEYFKDDQGDELDDDASSSHNHHYHNHEMEDLPPPYYLTSVIGNNICNNNITMNNTMNNRLSFRRNSQGSTEF